MITKFVYIFYLDSVYMVSYFKFVVLRQVYHAVFVLFQTSLLLNVLLWCLFYIILILNAAKIKCAKNDVI